jgi:flavin reductase (DIM6/NTAB) family NADH-FMN oxidoreductase RutF
MFYEPRLGHGLPHNPFNAIVSPRPIAWISTRSADGRDNLAPYSFFNAIAYTPPQIMFASTSAKADRGDTKDTLANIRGTGEFCVNIVETAAQDAMNATSGSYGADVDEFSLAGVDRAPCNLIAASRVASAPASLECRASQIVRLAGVNNFMVVAEVVGIHLRDDCLVAGRFDVTRFAPLARLGYRDYASILQVFELKRPGD